MSSNLTSISHYHPGEAMILIEDRRVPIDIIRALRLEGQISEQLMSHLRRIRRATFSFIIDAATGYIHSFGVGPVNNWNKTFRVVENIMRDKTRFLQGMGYDWALHCTPKVLIVDALNETVNKELVARALAALDCTVVSQPASALKPDVMGLLTAQAGAVDLEFHHWFARFDADVDERGYGPGALDKLEALMVLPVAASNYYPDAVGKTAIEKMAGASLSPIPTRDLFRLIFGWTEKGELQPDGTVSLFGIEYRADADTLQSLSKASGPRLFKVDTMDLHAISLLAEDGTMHEMVNTLDLPIGCTLSEWEGTVRRLYRIPGENRYDTRRLDKNLDLTKVFQGFGFADLDLNHDHTVQSADELANPEPPEDGILAMLDAGLAKFHQGSDIVAPEVVRRSHRG